jgi:DNA-binding winged helix-turn-helix (wHTH) protein/tetratricopeptide (TPR) repeat protein
MPSPDPHEHSTARFGEFELNPSCRELRLDGEPQPLQPLIFGVLCYLIRHRDRVVSKDELLEKLWPDTFVTESSLQKAISLARSVLRQGGAEDAIRTLPRQGYRFVADVEFREQPRETPTPAREQENSLARSFQQCVADGDTRKAAWTGARLIEMALSRMETTTARGWALRIERLLGKEARTREWGLLHAMHSRIALYGGDNEECLQRARITMELGRELGDPEIEALGLCHAGHALLSTGEVQASIEHHDEAAALALSGALDPELTGLVYCSVIWASSNRGDWGRANEWTNSYRRWCEQNPVAAYPGLCLLHRAEVHQTQGDLQAARAEIAEATAILDAAVPWAAGEAHRIQGQILLDLGDLAGAEAEFRRSLEFGWEPQPGYAWLLLARGRPDKALRGIRRAIDSPFWGTAERRAFLRVEELSLAVACGADDVAAAAIEALRMGRTKSDSVALSAAIARAEGELALHEGRVDEAVTFLRASRDGWLSVGSPPNAARARLRLADALEATGDKDAAAVEREALGSTFLPMGFALGNHP